MRLLLALFLCLLLASPALADESQCQTKEQVTHIMLHDEAGNPDGTKIIRQMGAATSQAFWGVWSKFLRRDPLPDDLLQSTVIYGHPRHSTVTVVAYNARDCVTTHGRLMTPLFLAFLRKIEQES